MWDIGHAEAEGLEKLSLWHEWKPWNREKIMLLMKSLQPLEVCILKVGASEEAWKPAMYDCHDTRNIIVSASFLLSKSLVNSFIGKF